MPRKKRSDAGSGNRKPRRQRVNDDLINLNNNNNNNNNNSDDNSLDDGLVPGLGLGLDDDLDECGPLTGSPNQPVQRNAANARERARMRVLSRAFCRLKTTLPWVPADTKLSKLDTLRLATSYIAHLRDTLLVPVGESPSALTPSTVPVPGPGPAGGDSSPSQSHQGPARHPLNLTWPFSFQQPGSQGPEPWISRSSSSTATSRTSKSSGAGAGAGGLAVLPSSGSSNDSSCDGDGDGDGLRPDSERGTDSLADSLQDQGGSRRRGRLELEDADDSLGLRHVGHVSLHQQQQHEDVCRRLSGSLSGGRLLERVPDLHDHQDNPLRFHQVHPVHHAHHVHQDMNLYLHLHSGPSGPSAALGPLLDVGYN